MIYSGNYSEIAKFGYLESRAKWMSKYGPTFIYYLGIQPVIVTEDLTIIKSIMVKNFDNFINSLYSATVVEERKGTWSGAAA